MWTQALRITRRRWGSKCDSDGATSSPTCCGGHGSIFLTTDNQSQGRMWVWIGVQDLRALHAQYEVAGAKIRSPPNNFAWGLEMQVEDLDGNVFRIGSDREKDEPFGCGRMTTGEVAALRRPEIRAGGVSWARAGRRWSKRHSQSLSASILWRGGRSHLIRRNHGRHRHRSSRDTGCS